MLTTPTIIFFDGICNLCNGFVQFVITRDPKGQFKFAPLQSATARQLLPDSFFLSNKFDSVILLENGKIYQESTAALRILRRLKGGWPLLYIFILLPSFLRDWVYKLVAKNRYHWFGQRESCMLPTPELKSRFIME